MAKRYNIRWRSSDETELKRVVKNYNAKINRLAAKNPENKNALPEKISVRQLRELVETRQDLNRELNSLKRFSQRGAEELVDVPDNYYNLKITKWQKEEMTRRAGIINRRRNDKLREMEKIEVRDRGQSTGYTKGAVGMGKASARSLDPVRPFTPQMNRADLVKKNRGLLKESQSTFWDKRNEMLRENYIKSLEDNFNANDIEDVIDQIRDMDFNEFRETFEAEGGNFELSYPPDRESYGNYLTGLKAIWTPEK